MTDSREAFSDIPSEEINLSNKKKNQSDDKVEKAINEIKRSTESISNRQKVVNTKLKKR